MHTCPAAMCTVWSANFRLSNHSYVHPTTTCSTHHFSLPHPTNSPSCPRSLPPHCPSHPTPHASSLPCHCLPTPHYPLTAPLIPHPTPLQYPLTVSPHSTTPSLPVSHPALIPLTPSPHLFHVQLMMVGMQDFDVDDWERHTMYKNYAKGAKQVQWFWQVSSPRT